MDGKSDAEELIAKALKDPSLLQALSSGGGDGGGEGGE
jgi:predicted component of type VI protein secretion system